MDNVTILGLLITQVTFIISMHCIMCITHTCMHMNTIGPTGLELVDAVSCHLGKPNWRV